MPASKKFLGTVLLSGEVGCRVTRRETGRIIELAAN